MVGLHLGLVFLVNFADLTLGMLIVHFFTFDPGWIRSPQRADEQIFFDGHCGLCHGFVRFVLREDQSDQPFLFAPLQGELVRSRITDAARAQLPDSIVVVDDKNNIFTRSAAIIYVMKRLGGLWLVAATLLNLVPRALRDFGYAVCASLRKAVFGTAQELCPLVPVQWRARFRN